MTPKERYEKYITVIAQTKELLNTAPLGDSGISLRNSLDHIFSALGCEVAGNTVKPTKPTRKP